MKFSWSPQTPPVTRGQVPTIRHVLYEYDGPKMVIAVDDTERQVIGIAVDEDYSEGVTRWLFVPLPPENFLALLNGKKSLRELVTDQQTRLVDLDQRWSLVAQWQVDSTLLPDSLLPEIDASLPELTPEFQARLLEEQTNLAGQRERSARTRLLFGGKPVIGRRAINASFAAEALGNYQELIAVAFSARLHGALASRGPIPDRSASTLFLSDMPRGSVGFELVEISEHPPLVPSELVEVVSEVSELIEAAAAGDQNFAETIAEFDPRVHPALRAFLGTLSKAEASLSLEVNSRRYLLDVERVRMAAERTAVDPREESDRPIRGELLGYLPASRRFEFRKETGDIIRGKISREMNPDDLHRWLKQPCTAHMRIVTVIRSGGETQAFTLLRLTSSV